ncbi:uncharacterized protein LOC133187464 isoform X2 [Saccostrea echinata]|uniref:uncharacterized protein LOC133187464 isoform X2 n=1 Tax=Saccostrea echinata TaxID=191078 RepID=UPI002A827E66|nr:uncharacterized protein LOC133187464 isoform X2 [Saccostrea echinata]
MDLARSRFLRKQNSAPCLYFQSRRDGTDEADPMINRRKSEEGGLDGDSVRRLYGKLFYPRVRTISESALEEEKEEQRSQGEDGADLNNEQGQDKPPPVPPRKSKVSRKSSRHLLGNSWPHDAQRNLKGHLENDEGVPNVGQSRTEWGSPQFTRFSNPEGSLLRDVQDNLNEDINHGHSQPTINKSPRVKPRLMTSRSSSSLFTQRDCANEKYHDFRRRFSIKSNISSRENFHPGSTATNSDKKWNLSQNAFPDLRRSPNSWPRLQMAETENEETDVDDHVNFSYAAKNDISVARSKSLNDTVSREQSQFHGNRPHSFNGLRDKDFLSETNPIDSDQARMDTSSGIRTPRSERKFYSELNSGIEISRENNLPSDGELQAVFAGIPGLETGSVTVLSSPRVSPDIFHDIPGLTVTSESEDTSGDSNTSESLIHLQKGQQFLAVPRKVHRGRRRRLSASASCSEESDNEPSPPLSRRGRRSAIVDTKNVGDVSPTNLSPEGSPGNSCDEGENRSINRVQRHRSSLETTMYTHPGELLVADQHRKLLKRNTIAEFSMSRGSSVPANQNDDSKKGRQSTFSLLKLMRSRSKESMAKLEDVLLNMKPSEFKDNHLLAYKNLHWSELIASTDKHNDKASDQLQLTEKERKRREAVWELFQSECVFLVNHLMVLKHCFMEPLKKCQVEGHLMYAEPEDLFGNLDELCYVSYTFCKDFIATLVKAMSSTEFGSTTVLLKAFDRFSSHSKDGDVYHTYCLNYTNALTCLERLRRNDDFNEFEKACCQDPRCQRLKLTDLLVAPLQHCTKLPLLLSNIRKYTEVEDEVDKLTESISRVEMSLQKMEDKMQWAKNYERVQEIACQLSWPPVTDFDPRVFIPEYLKPTLLKQPCDHLLLTCPDRQLLHEGQLTLIEATKMLDMYLFLFDDILLLTRLKKSAKKKQQTSGGDSKTPLPGDRCLYTVYKQPISLDRICLHDIPPTETVANGIKSAFVLVQISRYQQIIGVFTLQCTNDAAKLKWMDKLREAKEGLESVVSRRGTNISDKQSTGKY